MAHPTAWCSVLDDADDATARLIIRLQLHDLEELVTGDDVDGKLALDTYETELKQCLVIRRNDDVETVPEPPVEDTVLFQCISCQDHFDAEHCHRLQCEHWYCDACLEHLFHTAITDESLYPPRCCRVAIPYDDVSPFLAANVREQFVAKQEELDDRRRVYCCVTDCATYIGHAHRDGDVGTCPSCQTTTCVHCGTATHDGECVQDEATQQLNELAAREGWMKCRTCNRTVELNMGCHHMMLVSLHFNTLAREAVIY